MRYGLGILLLVVGAVLSFAVKDKLADVDLRMIGYIFMGAGVLALLLEIVSSATRGRRIERTRVVEAPPGSARDQAGPVVERERTVQRGDDTPL